MKIQVTKILFIVYNLCENNGYLERMKTIIRVTNRLQQMTLICSTHTLFTPGITINTPALRPSLDMFSLSNRLPNSLFEDFPFYGGILHEDRRKSPLVWPYCWHLPSTVVYSIAGHQRRKLTPRVCHCERICSSATYEIQCC